MTTDDVNYILKNQKFIEEKISYQFRNHSNLLVQAFTRKTFAIENEGYEDNEILELYGDQLVNTIMTKWLYDSYSTFEGEFFYSKKNEAELTKIRANYVNKSALAHCIDILNLDEFLLLGNSDEKNEVWRNEKVRCDLFEAIIGAIAVDSEWDFKKIEKSCKAMWGMLDFEEDYVSMLYQSCDDLNIKKTLSLVYSDKLFKCKISLYIRNSWEPEIIEAEGNSETVAKMKAAKKALEFFHDCQIKQIVGDVTLETAVQTLTRLYLKKCISKPEFNYFCSPDEDGCQIWRCECLVKEYENREGYNQTGIGEGYTKSKAKQAAAYDMICFILGKENDQLNSTWICPYCGAENSSALSICQTCFDDD